MANFFAIASEGTGFTALDAVGESRDGLLLGEHFAPPLYGTQGGDRLDGDAGLNMTGSLDDIVFGGDGRDRIRGRSENDVLFGDAGD
ncbi:MAG: hypothetical protein WBA10_12180, partial [Elainellaceae cyanobacterium]